MDDPESRGFVNGFEAIRRRTSKAVSEYGDDLFSRIAGALWQFFFVGVKEAINLYILIAIRLTIWSIVPLLVLFGLLLTLSEFGPGAMGLSVFIGLIVFWQTIVFLFSLLPNGQGKHDTANTLNAKDNDLEIDASEKAVVKDSKLADVSVDSLFRRRGAIKIIIGLWESLGRISGLIRDILQGNIKRNRLLGYLIRVVALGIGLVFSFRVEFGFEMNILDNWIFGIVEDGFQIFLRQPLEFLYSQMVNAQAAYDRFYEQGFSRAYQ
ncbi:MAG: hypothetical protein K8F59_13205 [Rhodobacteraceae bacterium]|nr:hypothetical protein [Paracoccaceae bacterium]